MTVNWAHGNVVHISWSAIGQLDCANEKENKIKHEAWSFSSRARWRTNTGGTHELSGSHVCVASFVLVLFLHFEFIPQTQNFVFWYCILIKKFGNFWQAYLPYRATKSKLLLARDDFCLPRARGQALSYNTEADWKNKNGPKIFICMLKKLTNCLIDAVQS